MSNKLTAIVVDDEPLSIDIIMEYVKAFPQLEIIGTYTKSKQAIEHIIALKPDLLFLDIHMPVLNGFELIEAIIEQHNPYIIFTTAYDQYAVRAFEVNAIGYLLKPFDKEKFAAAVNKFLAHIKTQTDNDLYTGIIKMLGEQRKETQYTERVLVKEQKKIFYVPVSDIIYFEAQGDYVKAITAKRYYLLSDSLTALEGRLSPTEFIRIHRSVILNAAYVKEFIPYYNNEYHIVMSNGETLKMSRSYRENLLRVFTELR